MRRVLAAAGVALAASAAAPPAAPAARVQLMVVGRSDVLREAAPVRLARQTVRVEGRRCRVAAATPLAVLARTGLRLRLRDYDACSRRPRDASGLYVRGVAGEVARGRSGWVYKVGRRVPDTGAADPASRLRAGARLLWFFCRSGPEGCQRTLAVRPEARTVAAGSPLRVTVTAYDDHGDGVPAEGATVTLGTASARTGADGVAVLTVPPGPATVSAVATAGGMVRSFPVRVRVP